MNIELDLEKFYLKIRVKRNFFPKIENSRMR